MQSISTNNLFMHGHEKWGASNIACPPLKKEGAPLPLRFRALWLSGNHTYQKMLY